MASSNNEKKAIPNERLPKDRVEEAYDPDWLVGTSAEKMFKSPIKTKQISPSKNSDFSDPVYKQLSRLNGRINRMSIDELTGTLGDLDLDSSGKKEVLIKRLKSHYKEKSLEKVSKNGLTAAEDALVSELSTKPAAETVTGIKVPKCPYDYVCVIDYEATCTETKIEDYPHEIIEFPVVLINMATLTIEDCFDSHCKPVLMPKLSKFCTSLTGITQAQVDAAEEFPIVLGKVEKWFKDHGLGEKYKYAIATDGPWDMQNFLNLQCFHSSLAYPRWAKNWIDVRKMFSNWFGVRRCNIEKMLEFCGFTFEGNQHCGLDDSKNIARILIRLAKDGCPIKVNAHIKKSLTDIEPKTTADDSD